MYNEQIHAYLGKNKLGRYIPQSTLSLKIAQKRQLDTKNLFRRKSRTFKETTQELRF